MALVDRRRNSRQTYAELNTAADVWAGNLRERGVKRGDRVVVIATNRHEIPELFFACCRVDASLVSLNWRLAGAELDAILTHARPVLVMGESRFLDLISPNNPAIRGRSMYVDLDDPPIDLTPNSTPSAAIADAELAPDDPALILYTSGSTGLPKGVIIPHRQILFNAVATATAWELGPSDIAPVATPFFHTGGFNVFATPLWHRGGTVVLFDQFEGQLHGRIGGGEVHGSVDGSNAACDVAGERALGH